MTPPPQARHTIVRPWRLFVVILLATFAIESTLMLALPWIVSVTSGDLGIAILDAVLLTITLAPIVWYSIIRPLQQLLAQRTRLLRQALTAQEEERGRVSRDLHDGLGQMLTSLAVGLRSAQEGTSDDNQRRQLERLRKIAGDTHEEVRRLSRGLRPSSLDQFGLATALERLCGDFADSSGRHVSTTFAIDASRLLPTAVETACYRAAQEAITNAMRHSGADSIDVTLRIAPEWATLTVCDNGKGLPLANDSDSQPRRAWSLEERVAQFEGTLHVESIPGNGTRVECHFPLGLWDSVGTRGVGACGESEF